MSSGQRDILRVGDEHGEDGDGNSPVWRSFSTESCRRTSREGKTFSDGRRSPERAAEALRSDWGKRVKSAGCRRWKLSSGEAVGIQYQQRLLKAAVGPQESDAGDNGGQRNGGDRGSTSEWARFGELQHLGVLTAGRKLWQLDSADGDGGVVSSGSEQRRRGRSSLLI